MKKFDYKKLIEFREEMGLSQNDLAYMCDISSQAVKYWEEGANVPNGEKLARISEVLDKPIDNFYTEAPE